MSVASQARRTRENSIGWMIQRLARQLDVAMGEQLAEHDLTLPQFAILMTVLEHEPLTQADIGRRFAMPAYTISRALDTLEASDLIVRRGGPTGSAPPQRGKRSRPPFSASSPRSMRR